MALVGPAGPRGPESVPRLLGRVAPCSRPWSRGAPGREEATAYASATESGTPTPPVPTLSAATSTIGRNVNVAT